MNILQRISAIAMGFIAGGTCVGLIESISALIHPMPDGLKMDDADAMKQWISTLPISAFLIVIIAWGVGCFVGTFVARRITPNRSLIPALIVWALLTIATLFNLITIPHPIWMWPVGILACLVGGVLGLILAAPKEYIIKTTRSIKAPVEKVFQTIARIEEFTKAVPGITNIEFLTDQHYGVGTRFKETRVMHGKVASTELEVTELIENQSIRIVSDAGGTIWDTIFVVKPLDPAAGSANASTGEMTEMTMQMDARPYNFSAKFITPMIMNMVTDAVDQDMDSVAEFCEEPS